MQDIRRAQRVAFGDPILDLQSKPRVEGLRRLAQQLHIDAGVLRLERLDHRFDRLLLEDAVVTGQTPFLLRGLVKFILLPRGLA